MSSSAETVIAALRTGDDQLAPIVRSLTPEQLTSPSAAAEWDVSQVLSHLGSGAVIALAGLRAGLAGEPNPGAEANQAVWARWDAMGPTQGQEEFLAANTELLAAYESLDETQRAEFRSDLGFLPSPVDLATAARFRLNEYALHSWDVRVAADPAATVEPSAVAPLLDQIAMMLGWIAKTAELGRGPVEVLVTLTDPDRRFGLSLSESPSLGEAPSSPDAALTAPAEAWLRLATGRLAAEHTPKGVTVTGDLTLDDLRTVFRGF